MARSEIAVSIADLEPVKAALEAGAEAMRAVERVMALADDYERAADEAIAETLVGQPSEAVDYYRRVQAAGYNAAARIRAAVAGDQ